MLCWAPAVVAHYTVYCRIYIYIRIDMRIPILNSRRSGIRLLDPKYSRDSRETCELKLVTRLASRESSRQKFCSETRFSQTNLVARLTSYKSHRQKFHSKTRFSRVSQPNFVTRLASYESCKQKFRRD